MKMHYTRMDVYAVQFCMKSTQSKQVCVRLTEYLFWWALMWNRLYNYILWCFDWMCRFFFFNFYFSAVWLWENEFCICSSLLLLPPPPPLLRKILMRNRETEWNNLFMKSLWPWLEYESKQVHGEKKRWNREKKIANMCLLLWSLINSI